MEELIHNNKYLKWINKVEWWVVGLFVYSIAVNVLAVAGIVLLNK